jgi:hypothetical protein
MNTEPELGDIKFFKKKKKKRIFTFIVPTYRYPKNKSETQWKPVTVEHTCNPSTQEAEAGGTQVHGYIMRPCLKKK